MENEKKMKSYDLPTGKLFVDEYENGQLETLSIGDYGRSKNVKADFLGYTKEINGVPNGNIMPLSEKWVITLSTQYGCPMKCRFCDCPKVPFKGNASLEDLKEQLKTAISLNPEIKYTERLNIHFARMGEPLFNFDNVHSLSKSLIIDKDWWQNKLKLRIETIHPVLTTSFPKVLNTHIIEQRLRDWCFLKNHSYKGQAGLQLSINSTSDRKRKYLFENTVLSLPEIAEICETLPSPIGRKYCLNFAYSSGAEIDGMKLGRMFDSDKFMCKITPIHNNASCRENNIVTIDGYTSFNPYRDVEESLIDAGFDVLVFIPSMEEEGGLITCGNAILSKDAGFKFETENNLPD
jgi:23S rRNA (adenine2503-C2)-methyltransferase